MNKQNTKKNQTKVALQKIKTFLNLTDLPAELNISTMTVNCEFDSTFVIENIGKYLQLSKNRIVTVHTSDGKRTLIEDKKKAKKKKKERGVFCNQASFKVMSKYKTNGKPVDVKLFKNGSLTLTGCNGLDTCVEIIEILCDELSKVRAVLDMKSKKIVEKPFANNIKNLNIENMGNFKIRMINTNFDIGFKIDRDSLYQIMLNENIECIYEPCVHACVNIKYYYNGVDKVSIFVFASGKIIITGGKTKDQIYGAFNFINEKLFGNYKEIIKSDLNDLLKSEGLDMLTGVGIQKLCSESFAIKL